MAPKLKLFLLRWLNNTVAVFVAAYLGQGHSLRRCGWIAGRDLYPGNNEYFPSSRFDADFTAFGAC